MHISLQHRRSRFSGSEEVTRQRNVINVLTQRLSFMMSMFGIDDGVLLNDDRNADGGGSVSEVKISSGNATSGNATNTANSDLSPKDSFQSAVLSAVCVEQQKQESRAKNFVVSGLPVGSNDDVKRLSISSVRRNLICSHAFVRATSLVVEWKGKFSQF